jgi:hypothetical protein
VVKVLVTGSREWPQDDSGMDKLETLLAAAILRTAQAKPPWTLLSGNARGADQAAELVWMSWGHKVIRFLADWTGPCKVTCPPKHRLRSRGGGTYCPSAGWYRNQLMVEQNPDLCVAFPTKKSQGTWDCVERARKAHIPVIVCHLDGSMEVL